MSLQPLVLAAVASACGPAYDGVIEVVPRRAPIGGDGRRGLHLRWKVAEDSADGAVHELLGLVGTEIAV